MLYAGEADLHCLAPGGQNGGSLPGTVWLVPDDGLEHWNSVTRIMEHQEGIPWAVLTCRVEEYLKSWYGVAQPFGSILGRLPFDNASVELARLPWHVAAAEMDLSTKIMDWTRTHTRHSGTVSPFTVVDRIGLGVKLNPNTLASILIAGDQLLEIEEYVTTVIEYEYSLFGVDRNRDRIRVPVPGDWHSETTFEEI